MRAASSLWSEQSRVRSNDLEAIRIPRCVGFGKCEEDWTDSETMGCRSPFY